MEKNIGYFCSIYHKRTNTV